MIEVNINPTVLIIGSFTIGWSIIMALLAGIVALLLFIVLARRSGLQKRHIIWIWLLTVIFGYIGAFLFSFIENLIVYHDTVINFGLRADGLPIVAMITIVIYARITKLSFWQLLDIGTPCLILFMAVYRIGCVLVGCCYGLPCDQPWAVIYNNPGSPAPLGTPIYPTQFFHLIWNVVVFAMVWLLRKSFKTPGALGLVGWILYFLGDFVIRFFRGNEPPVFGLSLSEITALMIIGAAVYLLVLRFKTTIRKEAVDN